ncbi:MAG TPA: NADP-dependent oxidoreductase [Xanthomonadales bacterium]|nr:NADP-dependent oxidoreductase [Xanthomonadales bacterium]
MLAAYIDRYGGPSVLKIGDLPEPTPGPSDLLVDVAAASVNPIDFKIRDGKVKSLLPFGFPLILGNDLSGTVRSVGAQVSRFKPGDRIVARLGKSRIGAFAQRALVAQTDAAHAPISLDLVDAAALPLAGLTAWQALFEMGQLQAGQSVLIHAGAGGVGHFALQLARWKGARVITTASAKNRERCLALGADEVIDYRSTRFDQVVRDVDVVLDTQGGDTLLRSIAITRPAGHVISITALPTPDVARAWGAKPPLTWILGLLTRRERRAAKARGVNYHYLFMRPDGALLGELVKLVDAGVLKPMINQRYPLGEAAAALAHVEAGHALGKVLVVP